MADDDIPTEVSDNIDRSIGEDPSATKRRKKPQPTYQVLGDSKIPVSSATGDVWKSRYSLGKQASKKVSNAWEECINYYANSQDNHRNSDGNPDTTGDGGVGSRLNDHLKHTENVVFSNITTMVPALYSRNPKVEFTAQNQDMKERATQTERLVNVLLGRNSQPGVGLKSKAKRCIVTSLLTNRSWITVDWITKEASSEQALVELQKLAVELSKAKNPKVIKEIEGKLMAMENTIDALHPAGPKIKFKLPTEVVTDPNGNEMDGSDSSWMIILDWLPTSFIRAKYATKKGDQYKSIFQPSHVMKLADKDADASQQEEQDFSIFKDDDSNAKEFGFDDEASFEKAMMTRVAFVWDKVTRRVLLFNVSDWKWPIWVWDDPLQLDTFFPAFPLTFFESPMGQYTKGEVSYYLDQADSINEISDEKRRARAWARRNIFFDKNRISAEDAQAVINGADGTVRGVDIPEGLTMKDLVFSIPTPSAQFESLFNKEEEYQAVDRISSVGEVLRGAQFKTNTTNRAVDANVSSSNMRVDEKSDAIEDFVGVVAWAIAQLCLMNMDQETVAGLIGAAEAEGWANMTAQEIQASFTPKVLGGSGKKPTSRAKKEEAIEVGQVLGQFVSISPVVVKIMLEVLQEAFDEVTIKEEDWDTIIEAIAQPQEGAAGPGAGQEQPPKPGPEEGKIENESAREAAELQKTIASLTPEQKQQVGQLIEAGTPPQEALAQVVNPPQATLQ